MEDTTGAGQPQNGQQMSTNQPGQTDPNQVTFLSVIKDSNSILVVLPTNPTFDQVSAGLSLYLSLRKHKNTQIFSPTPITVEFNRLIGVDKIAHEMGNKNLLIRFVNYDANNIEKVSYDIEENDQVRLTVIPKGDMVPPAKENINLSYSGISVDTVVLVGGQDESNFPSVTTNELSGASIIHVGLKQISLSSKNNFISFTRIGSSVSEIIYGLIRENQLYIDPDIATNLLMGVEEVVGDSFQGEGITAETFYTTADLMQYGARRHANKGLQGNFPPGSIPGQQPTSGQQMQQAPQPQNGMWGQNNPVDQGQSMSMNHSQQVQQPEAIKTTVVPEEVTEENAPDDWKQPKIYKGGASS